MAALLSSAVFAPATTRVAAQKHSTVRGSQQGLKIKRGKAVVTMAKEGIHPEFYPESKVYCNGEEVTSMGGTQESYTVDVWSGNHPFYNGDTGAFITDEGRVNRFSRRFGNLAMGQVIKGNAKDKEAKEDEQ